MRPRTVHFVRSRVRGDLRCPPGSRDRTGTLVVIGCYPRLQRSPSYKAMQFVLEFVVTCSDETDAGVISKPRICQVRSLQSFGGAFCRVVAEALSVRNQGECCVPAENIDRKRIRE